MESEIRFAELTDAELNDLVSGLSIDRGRIWTPGERFSPKGAMIGAGWIPALKEDQVPRPLFLVAPNESMVRLFVRFSQLHGDLSPLSTWCYILEPDQFALLDPYARRADLGNAVAAWCGLIIAEACLLAERTPNNIRLSECFATQSFALARSLSLWPNTKPRKVLEKYDWASELCQPKSKEPAVIRGANLRGTLTPLWKTLFSLGGQPWETSIQDTNESSYLREALFNLESARLEGAKAEAWRFAKPLVNIVPEARDFENLESQKPEQRLRFFDFLVESAMRVRKDVWVSTTLTLLAGYLSTVAAGGAPALSLAEKKMSDLPDVLGWAFLTGGIGERITWTSGFNGLGRIIARELTRPLRLEDSPNCDFSVEEAQALVDPQLPDPLVRLNIKQARLASVALLPGVNVSFPLTETPLRPQGKGVAAEGPQTDRGLVITQEDFFALLAQALEPHLRDLMEGKKSTGTQRTQKAKSKSKAGNQDQLPLRNPKR